MTRYDLAPLFVVRLAGFPIEHLLGMRQPELAASTDAVLRLEDDVERALVAVRAALPPRHKRVRRRLHRRALVEPVPDELADAVAPYNAAVGRAATAHAALAAAHDDAVDRARRALHAVAADEAFQHVLLMSSPTLEAGASRRREATWIRYLQRVTTKNDTISFFGPSLWGTVSETASEPVAIRLASPAIAARTVYLERWACVALADRIAADPEVAPLLRPRLRDDSDDVLDVGIELPLGPDPLRQLRDIVERWPDVPARTRWHGVLAKLAAGCERIAAANGLDERRDAMARLEASLHDAGVAPHRSSRALYAARRPFNEACSRRATVATIGAPLVEQLVGDLAPWYELWRDLAGLYATRLWERVVPVWRELSSGGPVRLPALLRELARRGLPLDRTGGVGIPAELEPEIQRAWAEQLGDRSGAAEVELTPDDLAFVRRRFSLSRMKAFDWPAPDVQIIARDAAALARGEWQALVGEIHPDFAPWAHALMRFCPDPEALAAAYDHADHPAALEFAAASPHHASVHRLSCAPLHTRGWTFTGPMRMVGVRGVRSAEIEVQLEGDDLVARDRDGAFLGSLVHTWAIATSTHQLELIGTARQAPRLRVGRVIVQRRSWVIDIDPELRAELARPAPAPWIAVRRLRDRHGWPEAIFVRPRLPLRLTEHKDTKPMMIDLLNPLLVDTLAGILARHKAVRVTEMLPGPEHHWLADEDGHYSCELRLVTVPARARARAPTAVDPDRGRRPR